MTELPRYHIETPGPVVGMELRRDQEHGPYCLWADISSRLQQLEEAASERDAIASLVSDREEAGTYPKVEGLLNHVAQLEQEKATLQQQLAVEREKHDEEAYNLMAEAKDAAEAALAETREALQRLMAASRIVVQWFKAIRQDQHEKLVFRQTLESASANWETLVTPPLDLQPLIDALANAKPR